MSGPMPLERIEEVSARGAVVAIGNFDGVHAGHRALLGHAHDLARRDRVPWVVVSFFPPAKVLFGGASYLSNRTEKHLLLSELGPTEVVIVPFDHAFAATPAERFVEAIAALEPTAVVVGEDFRFGRGRAGATEDLGRAASRVEVLRLVAVGGEVVKSSTVRTALEGGDLARANRLLGAPYLVVGTVVEGARRGRTIGVPTANLSIDAGKALPRGVFAVTVEVPDARDGSEADGDRAGRGRRYGGMANVGPRPSFEEAPPALEAHLFEFDGDLYGRELRVRLHERLRDNRRFAGLEELRAQLRTDEDAARAALKARDDAAGGRVGRSGRG